MQRESTTPALQKPCSEPMNYELLTLTLRKVCQESTEMKRTKFWISLEAKVLTAHREGSIFSIMAESTMQCCNSSMKDRSLLINSPFTSESWSHVSIGIREKALSLWRTFITERLLSLQVRWDARQFDLKMPLEFHFLSRPI